MLLRKNKAAGMMLFKFKLSYKAIVVKTVWYKTDTHRSMEQAREPINKSTLNGQLIYDKGSKNIK